MVSDSNSYELASILKIEKLKTEQRIRIQINLASNHSRQQSLSYPLLHSHLFVQSPRGNSTRIIDTQLFAQHANAHQGQSLHPPAF